MDRKELIYWKFASIFLVLTIASTITGGELAYSQSNENKVITNSLDSFNATNNPLRSNVTQRFIQQETAINREITSLPTGTLTVDIPDQMELGSKYIIRLRIYPNNLSDNINTSKYTNITNTSGIKVIKFTRIMRADLIGPDFNISRLSNEMQLISNNSGEYTEWDWDIVPQFPGNRQITVLLYALISLPDKYNTEERALAITRSVKVMTKQTIQSINISQLFYSFLILTILFSFSFRPMERMVHKMVEKWRKT